MIFVFDLDHTLCVPGKEQDTINRYAKAKPIKENIEMVRELKRFNNKVIIHTARRMLTHKGDVAMVYLDVGEITKQWLADHDVPYDELIFGKPYADIYIDDKGMTPELFKKIILAKLG